jgi:hypothetical protein
VHQRDGLNAHQTRQRAHDAIKKQDPLFQRQPEIFYIKTSSLTLNQIITRENTLLKFILRLAVASERPLW